MTLSALSARVRRLEQLTRGLAKEVLLCKECDDPLLHLERKDYLEGLQNGLAGLDDARAALVRGRQRLLSGTSAVVEAHKKEGNG